MLPEISLFGPWPIYLSYSLIWQVHPYILSKPIWNKKRQTTTLLYNCFSHDILVASRSKFSVVDSKNCDIHHKLPSKEDEKGKRYFSSAIKNFWHETEHPLPALKNQKIWQQNFFSWQHIAFLVLNQSKKITFQAILFQYLLVDLFWCITCRTGGSTG